MRIFVIFIFIQSVFSEYYFSPLEIITPRIILYDNFNQTGKSLTVAANYIPKLSAKKFHDRARSICINGTWILYENENYNNDMTGGVEYFMGDSYCSNLNALAGKVRSLRFVGSSLDIRSDSVTFYSKPFFQGFEEYFTESTKYLYTLNNQTQSLIVIGHSDWNLYDQEDYKGDSFCVRPDEGIEEDNAPLMITDTDLIHIPHGSIASIKLGCFN